MIWAPLQKKANAFHPIQHKIPFQEYINKSKGSSMANNGRRIIEAEKDYSYNAQKRPNRNTSNYSYNQELPVYLEDNRDYHTKRESLLAQYRAGLQEQIKEKQRIMFTRKTDTRKSCPNQ